MIRIETGDLTRCSDDAIVNAANPIMLGGGGVDGAIHAAAGPQLRAACEQIPAIDGIRCPTGGAHITPAFKLPCRFVIHTVGPRYQIDSDPERLLHNAYTNSLHCAQKNNLRSIAFPAISCGVYGYPADEAASIALNACQHAQWQHIEIRFVLFTQALTQIWQNALKNRR